MKKSGLIQFIVIIAFVSILGIAGYFVWRSVSDSGSVSVKKGTETDKASSGSALSQGEADEQTYTHPDYGFTLKYPAGNTLGRFPEGEGEVVLVQGKTSEGFQIFISPYTEEEDLSKEVILKAEPKMKIENEKTISLGSEGINALVFDSTGDTGATHEVWFVVDGNLYQCTSFKDYGGKMEEILGSIRFN